MVLDPMSSFHVDIPPFPSFSKKDDHLVPKKGVFTELTFEKREKRVEATFI